MRTRQLVYFLPLILVAGCAGYQLGPTNGLSAGEKTVQVNFLRNDTIEPRLSEAVTLAIRKRVQQDGTYKLATQGDGDVIVTGAIMRYERSALSFQPRDVLTVRDYRLGISARVVAIDRRSGKTNANQIVRGRTTVRVGSDLPSAERQAIPLAAADLARNAVAAIADGTW